MFRHIWAQINHTRNLTIRRLNFATMTPKNNSGSCSQTRHYTACIKEQHLWSKFNICGTEMILGSLTQKKVSFYGFQHTPPDRDLLITSLAIPSPQTFDGRHSGTRDSGWIHLTPRQRVSLIRADPHTSKSSQPQSRYFGSLVTRHR